METKSKWMDLTPFERHTLIGELIDAMIYSGEAVEKCQLLCEIFRRDGLIKSKILPNESDTLPA